MICWFFNLRIMIKNLPKIKIHKNFDQDQLGLYYALNKKNEINSKLPR